MRPQNKDVKTPDEASRGRRTKTNARTRTGVCMLVIFLSLPRVLQLQLLFTNCVYLCLDFTGEATSLSQCVARYDSLPRFVYLYLNVK